MIIHRRGTPPAPARRAGSRRRLVPSCDRLETLCLLSTASPVISGYVFADTNNDGVHQASEAPIAGTRVALFNSAHAVVATTTTGANGFYAFSAVSAAPGSVTQTLTLPAAYTNIDAAAFSSALKLFDPSLGTLNDVKISGVVTVSSTIGGENTSLNDTADIEGSVAGTAQVRGLSQPLSGTLSASSPVFHAATSDGTVDFAGASGTTFNLAPTQTFNATLTNAPDLAFYTATPGHTAVAPTATIHASVSENASTDNIQFMAATKGSAVLTVTYDYTPSNALKPGAYTVVPLPTPGFVQGKASTQTGTVVVTGGGTREVALNLTAAGSAQNNFGRLPVPKTTIAATSHPITVVHPVTTPTPPKPKPKPVPVASPSPTPSPTPTPLPVLTPVTGAVPGGPVYIVPTWFFDSGPL